MQIPDWMPRLRDCRNELNCARLDVYRLEADLRSTRADLEKSVLMSAQLLDDLDTASKALAEAGNKIAYLEDELARTRIRHYHSAARGNYTPGAA